ncbi:hypothetical protein JXB12_04235 [candidate division KSB1 bacterium]|nr:hypothetical protein [candidate division KSB1 bacterium]
MGRKDRTFASKMAKGAHKVAKVCPKCGEPYQMVKVVSSEKNDVGVWKFKENVVAVCKCNEKEMYA